MGEPTELMIQKNKQQQRKLEMFSPAYYLACGIGGALSCGLTHTAITPMDVVKCNMQQSTEAHQRVREEGIRGLMKGWAPTLIGYSAQGACKYGLYEFFKKYYSDIAGPQLSAKYGTLIYLAGSASSEFLADVALCPMESIKVRLQTQPSFAKGLSDGLPKLYKLEGFSGLYKGIGPLWARQVPYTMAKFATFENTVEWLYKHAIPYPKKECSLPLQVGVSFTGGYMAGVFCATISHPADNLVSFFNNSKGATLSQAVEKMGLWGLCTRGLPLRIVMVGTLTGVQWGIYDSFKLMIGLPTTSGVHEEAKT